MEPMNLGSPVQSPVGHLGMQHASYGFQSPAPGTQPQFHSTMVGGVQHSQGMTPMGQSPVVAGSNMMQRDAGNPGFLPGYLIGSFPQQVRFFQNLLKLTILKSTLLNLTIFCKYFAIKTN